MYGGQLYFARSNRLPKMKILYIVPFVPWPVRVRSFNLIPRLARNHQIHLVCVSSVEPSAEQGEWLSRYCENVVHVPHSPWRSMAKCAMALPTQTPLRIAYCRSKSAQTAVHQVYEQIQPDVLYVERWRALQYVPADAEAPVVCDPTDSMTLYNRRLIQGGTWWEKLMGWEEYKKFLHYEGKLARQADLCVFCSKVDMECVKKQAPDADCALVPNAVDCAKYFFKHSEEEESKTLVFAGSFKYRPNFLAVKFFMEKIFPIVQQRVPDVKFLAVGNAAGTTLRRYESRPGFKSIDFVSDLRPYLAKATIAVVPLTVGAGVSNKLAEGFAVGTPVVATPLACGDLPLKSGEQLLVGKSAEEFAEHVIQFLRDKDLRGQVAARARRFVEKEYDWEISSGKLEAVFDKLVAVRTGKKDKPVLASA